MSQRRLSARVYWRRRLLTLAVLGGLVWLVLRVVGVGGDDSDRGTAATPTASASQAPAASATTRVDGVVDVSLASGSKACDPEKIRITPSVAPGQRTKGPVDIGLVVSSTETVACTLKPGDADLLAVISANGTPVWDSTVCETSLLVDPVAISPEWSSVATARWSGRGSGSTCSSKEGYAAPGAYAVQVGTLGGEPGKASFSLKAKPAPKSTKKTRSTKTSKSDKTSKSGKKSTSTKKKTTEAD